MTPFCQQDIESEEGFEAQAYPDPLSPLAATCAAAHLLNTQYRQLPAWRTYDGSPWTDGYGQTSPQINADSTINQVSAGVWIAQRIASLSAHLAQVLSFWPSLSDPRQDVLVNMSYELGVNGLLAFHQTLGYVAADEYVLAAEAMLQSDWAKQVPQRAQRLAQQMKTGVRLADA